MLVSRLNTIRLADIHIDVPQLVLMLIAIPLLFLALAVYPQPWYDEGYSMQVSRLLMDEGVYGTYNAAEGYRPFDPTISSGPTIILPMTLAFRYFGVGVVQARLIIAIYALIAIYSTYLCVSYLYGKGSAFFITLFLFLLAVPQLESVNFVQVSRQVLGETPAFALTILGLFIWFRSWEHESWSLSILSGLIMGLGVISKPQIVFGLFPALTLIVAARVFTQRSKIIYYAIPLVMIAAAFGAWTLIQRLGTTPEIRSESGVVIAEAMRLHFFTGLFGRNLSKTAIGLTLFMGLAVCIGAWRINRQCRQAGMTNRLWAESTLVLIILCSAVWFSLLSVGFERYSYLPVLLSMLLFGKSAYDLLGKVSVTLSLRARVSSAAIIQSATVILVLGVVGLNVIGLLRNRQAENDLVKMADVIGQEIPQEAMVESLEVELNAIAPQREYHHANYRYIYQAIDQGAHQQQPFDLDYDVLQADPDFLIVGRMSDWLQLYDPVVVEANFRQIADVGIYRLYERVRTEVSR